MTNAQLLEEARATLSFYVERLESHGRRCGCGADRERCDAARALSELLIEERARVVELSRRPEAAAEACA